MRKTQLLRYIEAKDRWDFTGEVGFENLIKSGWVFIGANAKGSIFMTKIGFINEYKIIEVQE